MRSMESGYLLLRSVYIANVIVAGLVGSLSLFAPATAARTVFEETLAPSSGMQLIGSFWLTIAVLSAIGFFRPMVFVPVLLVQLLYKGGWLAVVAAPALLSGRGDSIPGGVAVFFLVWVVALPFVIPWTALQGD